MTDQHGNEIPKDLVFIQGEKVKEISHYDLHNIMSAAWYELILSGNSILCASKQEVSGVRDEFIFKFIREEEIRTARIYVINDANKRFHQEKGFYVN